MEREPGRTVRIELSLRSIFSILAIVLGLWLVSQLWFVILLVLIAALLAGALVPVVDGLERRRLPRALALGLVALLLVVAIAGLGFLAVPALVAQLGTLLAAAPAIQAQLAAILAALPLGERAAAAVREAQPERLLEPLLLSALGYAGAAAELVAYGVTVIVLAFYMLADRERVLGFLYALLPRRFHVRTARILLDLQVVVGGYMRGQALTSLLFGTFTYALLASLGAPGALAVAIFAAFANLIPFIGTPLATVPTVLVALPLGATPGLIALAACLVYEQFEGRWLLPHVYGQTLRLSPVAVTIALLAGGTLLGIIGALLALPLAAGLRVLVEDLRIELPGEQTAEPTQRRLDAQAEAAYAAQAEGSSAAEAAQIATALAEQLQAAERTLDLDATTPIAAQADAPSVVAPTSAPTRPS